MIRITAAAPEALQSDCNHLAMALGMSLADAHTYDYLGWVDSAGNRYACASFEVRPEWAMSAQSPLQRPAWDTTELIDMPAAARAQAALVFWAGEGAPPVAQPGKLTAIGGVDGVTALGLMGVAARTLININTATAKELEAAPGVGYVKAGMLIEGRPWANVKDAADYLNLSPSVLENWYTA